MLVLTKYNDGKEKYQSVEVGMRDLEDKLRNLDFSSIYGFGYNTEEAFENFTNNFEEFFSELKEFRNKLITRQIPIYEADCSKNIIEKVGDK